MQHTTYDLQTVRKPFGGINANTLRFLALGFMLLDHLWATLISGNLWMTCLGRLAFPIFAFQIAEGFFHTHDRRRYAMRLLIFAVISEIPFNLMMESSMIFPFHQNVMFTLLLGLMSISCIEKLRNRPNGKTVVKMVLALLGILLLATIGFVDYGPLGVLTVVTFYLFRGFRGVWILQLAAMLMMNVFLFEGQTIPFHLANQLIEFPIQGFAVFALFPIWLYNGQKGHSSRALQYGAYAFYPVHMLILSLLVFLR